MSTVTPTSSATPAATKASSVGGLTSAADQEDRFMKLLVAQMKNQDPLNPMDNAQMTSQIAQINTVGGIEKLNRTVESLLSAFSAMQGQNATQLAGHDVLVEGNTLALGEGPVRGGIELKQAASAARVEILDADGDVVRTIRLGAAEAGVRTFEWDGKLDDGSVAAQGAYRFRAVASQGSAAVAATTLSAARVIAVSPGANGTTLDLGAAGTVPLADVRSYL